MQVIKQAFNFFHPEKTLFMGLVLGRLLLLLWNRKLVGSAREEGGKMQAWSFENTTMKIQINQNTTITSISHYGF